MMDLWKELPWAARRVLRRPAFFVLAASLLAVGTGAALFVASLYDQIVFQKLPVARPDELVLVQKTSVTESGETQPLGSFSRHECRTLRREAAAELDLVCFAPGQSVAGFASGTERVATEWVSPNYFSMLGLRAAGGRLFEDSDEPIAAPGSAAVLSYAAWERRFGLDPGVFGRTLPIDGRSIVVIGAAPPGYRSLRVGSAPELFQLASSAPARSELFQGAGRLRPAATAARAEIALRQVHAALLAEEPGRQAFMIVDGKPARVSERVDVVAGAHGDASRQAELAHTLVLVGGMIGVVLLILCVNLANLLAARAADARRQNAVRRALGATRGRLAAAWLAESVMLCAGGSAMGLWFVALWGPALLRAVPDLGLAGEIGFQIDRPIALLGFALTLATALLVGGLAAWEASRTPVAAVLQGGGAGAVSAAAGRQGAAWRWELVALQVGLSIVLLVGMGLLARSLDALLAVETGMPLDRVLTFRLDMPPEGVRPPQAIFGELRDQLAALPGVRQAAYATVPLLSGARRYVLAAIEGYTPAPGEALMLNSSAVSPGFFEALGIPAVRGRTYGRADAAGAPRSIVVNQRFVERYLGGREPLGGHVSFDSYRGNWSRPKQGDLEIVGVVGDRVLADVREPLTPRLYPLVAATERTALFYVRTAGAATPLATAVRRLVRATVPEAAVGGLHSLKRQRDLLLGKERLVGRLSQALGLLAALITALGLYGVVRLAIGHRLREIAVRIALGARRGDVARLVSRDAARALLAGLLCGAAAAVPATRLLRSFLYRVEPGDPRAFSAAILLLLLAATLACWLPVRRALRTDPAAVLRQD